MFSRRTGWQLSPNALSQALDHLRQEGRALIDLTEVNPTHAGLGWSDGEGLRAALSQEGVLEHLPDPFGLPTARAALAQWLGRRGLRLPITQLCLTASTSEAYAYLFKLLCDPGDAVLVPTPSYPLFDYLAGLEGLSLHNYPLRYDGEWHIDFGTLEATLLEGPPARALVAIHPNNPTGNYLKPAELDRLRAICAAQDLALISDEVFYEHGVEPPTAIADRAASGDHCLTFTLGGLSKLAGLPQLKLGWIAVNGPPELVATALGRLEVIADSYLSVGAPVQHALPYVLRHTDAFLGAADARLRKNLAALDRALVQAPHLSRLRCEGGFCAVLRLPQVRSSEDWALHLLVHNGLLVQPGAWYGLTPDAYVVVSLLCDEATFAAGVSTLAAGVRP